MHKSIFFIILLGFLGLAKTKAQDISEENFNKFSVMEVVTWETGRYFAKEARKANLPKGSKICVLPFSGRRATHDTAKTPLGVRIANEVSFRMKKLCQSRRLKNNAFQIISHDAVNKQLGEVMRDYFVPPDSEKEESELWKSVANNQKPDFFLVGKYEILGDYAGVRVFDVQLLKDKFSKPVPGVPQQIALGNSQCNFEIEEEKENFKKWDVELVRLADAFVDLVNYRSKGLLADANIMADETDKVVARDSALVVGKDYYVSLNLKEDAYVYAFYYESGDLLGNKMYMIFPFEADQKTWFKKGLYKLPSEESNFSPSPPAANQILAKIIISKKELPVQISQTSEGYVVLESENCLRLVNALEKLNPTEVDSRNLIREVREAKK